MLRHLSSRPTLSRYIGVDISVTLWSCVYHRAVVMIDTDTSVHGLHSAGTLAYMSVLHHDLVYIIGLPS